MASTLPAALASRNATRANQKSIEQAILSIKTGTPKWYGWSRPWVVPAKLLADFINGQQVAIEAELTNNADGRMPGSRGPLPGWLDHLATRASQIQRVDGNGAMIRRLFDILHDRCLIANTDSAEALVMACGLRMDEDTNIPTLPSTRAMTFELLRLRAQAVEPNVELMDLVPMIPTVMQLSAAIIESPELLGHLQDDAPFDCLRPWKR